LSVAPQGDAASEDHDPPLIGALDSVELLARLTVLASSALMRPARRSSKASKSISRNSSPSRASKGLYLGFVSFAMGRLLLSRPSVRRNYMATTTCQRKNAQPNLLTKYC
jgi:hypothetical protein